MSDHERVLNKAAQKGARVTSEDFAAARRLDAVTRECVEAAGGAIDDMDEATSMLRVRINRDPALREITERLAIYRLFEEIEKEEGR